MTTWRPFSPSRSEQDPRPLHASLERAARRLGVAPPTVLSQVFTRWADLVGPDIAAHCRPESLRGGLLVLIADQPAWASQLRYMTGDVLARIAAVTGGPDVTDIQIRVARTGPSRSARNPRPRDA